MAHLKDMIQITDLKDSKDDLLFYIEENIENLTSKLRNFENSEKINVRTNNFKKFRESTMQMTKHLFEK
jgi:hypothetical protein